MTQPEPLSAEDLDEILEMYGPKYAPSDYVMRRLIHQARRALTLEAQVGCHYGPAQTKARIGDGGRVGTEDE